MKPSSLVTRVVGVLAIFATSSATALAQAAAVSAPQGGAVTPVAPVSAAASQRQAEQEPKRFVTHHVGRFNGREVRYAATAGETFLRDPKGIPRASVFSFAYLEEGVADPTRRPVTFLWNGGPGSSSIWLHIGSFGPVRVVVPSDARYPGLPPYRVEPNPETLLDVTDLVFVDPVGTGFSRALGEHKDEEFWGLDEDANSIAEFVRDWLTQHKRWNSPRFLAGESFGTTRAAAVADLLQRQGVDVNGLVLISQALNYEGSTPEPENLPSFITYLPTMAATAWYHGRVTPRPARLEDFLDEARRFAVDEYAPALLHGSRLDAAARARIRKRLSYFTGLEESYIERSDLHVLASRFLKELLRDKGVALGRADARYTVDEVDDVADRPEGDPASSALTGAFLSALRQHIGVTLTVDVPWDYRASSSDASAKWKWRTAPEGRPWEPSYVDVAPRLGRTMRNNPALRVFLASGYYDYATPFFDGDLIFARYGIVTERVTMKYYEAGHMMYVHEPSRQRLMSDVRAFLAGK